VLQALFDGVPALIHYLKPDYILSEVDYFKLLWISLDLDYHSQ